MKNKQAIGILGGMGPGASVYLYKKLIDLSISQFHAKNNDDFPEIIIHSIPVQDFISDENEKASALEMLKDRVQELNKLPLSYLSIACNTAHLLLDDLQAVSRIPFVSIIDEVILEVKADKREKVGLLGTPAILHSQLYQRRLAEENIITITPNLAHHSVLEGIIRSVINNTTTNDDIKKLLEIADELQKDGAEAIILGCTELPQIFPSSYRLPIYNSVEVLAIKLLSMYYKKINRSIIDEQDILPQIFDGRQFKYTDV